MDRYLHVIGKYAQSLDVVGMVMRNEYGINLFKTDSKFLEVLFHCTGIDSRVNEYATFIAF
jgi:hypothetical protein